VIRTLVLSLCAAMAFGSSVALQERAAAEVHREHAMKIGLLLRVARRPLWLLGLLASVAGLLLHIAALRHGSLVRVQPVMATTLIFALALVAIRTRVHLSFGEWSSVAAVVGGLVVFLVLASPNGHAAQAPHGTAWALSSAIAVVVVGGLAWLSTRCEGRRRAALLGLATGLSNAYVAVLTKAFSRQLRHGGPLWSHWALWGLMAAGIPAVLLVQSLYQSGNLQMSLPMAAIVEPIAACFAGVILFGEHVTFDGEESIVIGIGLAAAIVGLWHLAGNPRITLSAERIPRVATARPNEDMPHRSRRAKRAHRLRPAPTTLRPLSEPIVAKPHPYLRYHRGVR
jgi:drug/metabolite transporter (DMT)-like permease